MGYDIGITRATHLHEAADSPITEAEWRAVAEADSELEYVLADEYTRTSGGVEETFHPWVYASHPSRPAIWFVDGVARVKNPDEETVAKLFVIATKLDAQVVGDEGETYDENGKQVGYEEPEVEPRTWWRRLFQR